MTTSVRGKQLKPPTKPTLMLILPSVHVMTSDACCALYTAFHKAGVSVITNEQMLVSSDLIARCEAWAVVRFARQIM